MAYCCTTHKAQGETFTENFTIWDWNEMTDKLKYTAMSRATRLEQIFFGKYNQKNEYDDDAVNETLKDKIRGHKDYDEKNGFKCNITTNYLKRLLNRSQGTCTFCGCDLKTYGYEANDPDQISIDRIDNTKGHVMGNVVFACWGCNRNRNTNVGEWSS
jgi:hypothetical protein